MLVVIVSECRPSLRSGDPDELELAFEMLKPSKLIKLKQFVEGYYQKDWIEWKNNTDQVKLRSKPSSISVIDYQQKYMNA